MNEKDRVKVYNGHPTTLVWVLNVEKFQILISKQTFLKNNKIYNQNCPWFMSSLSEEMFYIV